ncbi:MAG TPA: amidohydrolase family protein [Candidatus Binataceae bacterium]|nr:amidohydrolase family protein [Candidatus Binataceae bacterium]
MASNSVTERDSWLAQANEEPLEPALPIIDPHHHLWDHPGSRYLLEEILSDTGSGHRVIATVFVECMSMYRAEGAAPMKPVGETEFVNGVAAQSASGGYGETRIAAGIVGFADLALGAAVEPVLQAHIAAAPARFRGIRHAGGFDASPAVRNSHTNPPPELYKSPRFREGFSVLGKLGLSFDAWQYHPQMREVIDLARAFPGTTIILDHFGGPLGIGPYEGRRAEIFAQWKKDLAELARCPNVVAKLGGINMPVNGFDWHKRPAPPSSDDLVAATRDYYLHAIDRFGPARCMFESNFPVDRVSCSYRVLWNSFKKIAAGFNADEKASLFHRTAAQAYRLATAPA